MNIGEHGIFFLIGLALFPRITLLFFASTPFGFLTWLGWLFAPHLLVAVLSIPYWDTHPLLVIIAWVCAFGGTAAETKRHHRMGLRLWRRWRRSEGRKPLLKPS